MTDREKVIEELERVVNAIVDGYIHEPDRAVNAIADAIALLKDQDAVEPTFKQDNDGIFVWACGSCGAYMYHIYTGIDKANEYAKYCRQCGKKVKWE